MPWGLCDCGLSVHVGSPASLKSSIARCRSERVQSDGLQLAQGPMQMSTTLFAILSHKDVHHLDRKLTKQLLAMGARKQQILVKWGFCYPHRCHMGRQLRYNEICAFSYRFALMKVVYSELEKQQMCGGGTSYSTVVLMENNTKLCTTWPHLKQTCESVPLTRTVHWVGYIRKWWKPWLKRQSASQLPFSIQGSKCIVCRGSGLAAVWEAMVQDNKFFSLRSAPIQAPSSARGSCAEAVLGWLPAAFVCLQPGAKGFQTQVEEGMGPVMASDSQGC